MAEKVPLTSIVPPAKSGFGRFLLLLALTFAILFYRSFDPNEVIFSNDGPLGGMVAEQNRMPGILTGVWGDLNWIGTQSPTPALNITSILRLPITPLTFSKAFPVLSLLILGLGAWFCFRQMKLAPLACILGGFAAALSSHFFATACWGVASQTIAFGLDFAALGLLFDDSSPRRWVKTVLAGLAVGMNIMEAYDIGAIFSLFIAAFVVFQSFQRENTAQQKVFNGALRVAVVAIFAAFLATEALISLVGTQIKGVAGTEQTAEAKAARWDFATQWSIPKSEVPRIVIPGLFGYRMDTPKDMAMGKSLFEGGVYWGKVGETPGWSDHHTEPEWARAHGGGSPRFSGGGEYAGILVVAVALWAVLQAIRKRDSIYSLSQRKFIWFWAIAAFISLLFAFGRYAPFYQFVYMLPYFSTIRNPAKFMHPFHFSLVILFAYGLHGLVRRYVTMPAGALAPGEKGAGKGTVSSGDGQGLVAHLKTWWRKADPFEKKWGRGSFIALGVSVIAWLIYASSKPKLEQHLREVGFPDPTTAVQIANFSMREVLVFIVFLAVTLGLLLAVMSGWFAGKRARLGALLLGGFLVFDLARANLPWVIYWNYKDKYATNPVIEFLRNKPYEHRVALFPAPMFLQMDRVPVEAQQVIFTLDGLYRIEWNQHAFQYYNIQTLDIIQMPRQPVDYVAFESTLARIPVRRWELTNTRYLVAPVMLQDFLNQQIDPAHRFQAALRFDIVPKPGQTELRTYDQFTAVANTNGQYALFAFNGALPRASLYSHWQVNTNDETTLQTLANPSFEPAKTVLVSSTPTISPAAAPTDNTAGTVDFVRYTPKNIILQAKATAPAILLLNDKYDPNWKLTVDGKPETLLRCNYLMRGIQLAAGEHRIELRFEPPIGGLYISLAAIVLGLGLIGFLAVSKPAVPATTSTAPTTSPESKGKERALAQVTTPAP